MHAYFLCERKKNAIGGSVESCQHKRINSLLCSQSTRKFSDNPNLPMIHLHVKEADKQKSIDESREATIAQ